MKDLKKLPKNQLEKYSTIFMQLGLVLTLFIVFVSLEYKTKKSEIVYYNNDIIDQTYVIDEKPVIIIKQVDKLPQPKKEKAPKVLDDIEKGDEDIVELPFDEPNEDDIIDIIDEGNFVEAIEDEEPEDDTHLFINLDSTPVFKGCEDLPEKENKICFEKKLRRFVSKKFNADIAQDIGLKPGKHRIFTQFIIDKEGNITDISIRTTHKILEKETSRVINKIPQFIPGKRRGKPVKVKYSLPISFQVN